MSALEKEELEDWLTGAVSVDPSALDAADPVRTRSEFLFPVAPVLDCSAPPKNVFVRQNKCVPRVVCNTWTAIGLIVSRTHYFMR